MPRHACGSWPGTALSEISKAEGYWCGEGALLVLLCVQGAAAGLLPLFWATVAFPGKCAWLSCNLKRGGPATSWLPFGALVLIHLTACMCPQDHLTSVRPPPALLPSSLMMIFAPVPVCFLNLPLCLSPHVSPLSADGSFQTVLKQLPQAGFKNRFSLNSKDD